MRFIHTADWHLGRVFHGIHLTHDQRFTLQGLLRVAASRDAEAVVIAGDVFDRAVPPPDAVDLLDEIVGSLALDLGITVVMIAGNHDSPARLEYFSGLAKRTGVHVVGRVGAKVQPVEVVGGDGTEVRFWPLAYTDPETGRYELNRDDLHSHEAVITAQLETMALDSAGSVRNVLVAHAFVAGCRQCESERELTVGGTASVSTSLFDGFDYVALGHLHQGQTGGSDRVRYAGSLLKYSFGEAGQQKSVSVVDLGPSGGVSLQEVLLPVRRDVRQIRGTFAELLSEPMDPELAEAYVEAILIDTDPVLSPVDTLRTRYPHLLSLRREESQRTVLGPTTSSVEIKTRNTADLFADFFLDVKGESISEPQSAELAAALEEMERKEREAVKA